MAGFRATPTQGAGWSQQKESTLNIRRKVFAGAAILTALGTAGAAGSLPAFASSTGCAFSNGCATLHGTDANNHAIAMDAKHQSAKAGTLIIGYPDVPGDGATSFDAVLHYTTGAKKTAYADTGLSVKDFDNTCKTPTSKDVAPAITGSGGATGAITAGGNDLSVSTSATGLTVNGGGTATLNWIAGSGSHTSSLELAETYGAGCVANWTTDVVVGTPSSGDASFVPFTLVPGQGNNGGRIHEQDTGSSVDTFTDTVTGGTFTFTGLPAGVSQSGGVLTADSSTAIPGTYTSVGVVYTEPGGVIDTASFTLVVSGIKSVNPGNDIPYYTFAYAKGGVWSNECVTDNGGSAALVLAACTLGKDQYQDFYAETTSGGSGTPVLLSGGSYFIQNKLAAVTSPASSCLTDPSVLDPATPQSDAVDESAIPAGRQLRVDGPCLAGNTWTWAS